MKEWIIKERETQDETFAKYEPLSRKELVRCKDCKWFNGWTGCDKYLTYHGGNWFCADGEKIVKNPSYRANSRYRPGEFNGLDGGMKYALYFNKQSHNRIVALAEISQVLTEEGVLYGVCPTRRYWRIIISAREFKKLSNEAKVKILTIDLDHSEGWAYEGDGE